MSIDRPARRRWSKRCSARRRLPLCAAVLSLGLLVLTGATSSRVAAQSVWERTPYRTAILLTVSENSGLPRGAESKLRDELQLQIETRIGGAWTTVFETPPPVILARLVGGDDRIRIEDLPPTWASQYDKVLWIVIDGDSPHYSIRAGDFDLQTQTSSPAVNAAASHPGVLATQTFRTLCRAFAPLARVEEVEEDRVVLRLRAASLLPAAAPLGTIPPGSMFQPIVRYEDRAGDVRRIDTLAWSVLRVEEVGGAELTCKLFTGIRSPLSARRRGRSEQLALLMILPQRPSELTLHGFRDPYPVLPDYEVFALRPGEKKATLLGRSDAEGRLSIPQDPESSLRILLVKNGSRYLARLPLVPGYESELNAPIANDDERLAAESRLMGLQEEIIDLVTEREVLSRRIRAMLDAEREEAAQDAYARLRGLKSRDAFLLELSQERTLAISEDDLSQRRIDAMFDEMRQLVTDRLNPREVEILGAELTTAFPPES